MEPHWREAVLKQDVYFSQRFEEDHAYDLSTREDFHLEIQKRESKKVEEIIKRQPKAKNFFDVLDKGNSVTARLKMLEQESVFQPSRNYWFSYKDYITYSLCTFVMQFEVYALMKQLMSKGTGLLCLTAFILTKLFVNWIVTYIIIAIGAYHKQGIFHLRYLLPIAKYVPYVTTGMLVWNMSARIDLYSEVLLYFFLYILAEIYIIDLKFSGCNDVLELPTGVFCYNAFTFYRLNKEHCKREINQEFIFTCGDHQLYLLPEQVILQYMHKNATYIFMRNVSMCFLFFILLLTSGRVYKLLKIIRIGLFLRVMLYIFLIIISKEAVYLSFKNKNDDDNEMIWSFKSLIRGGDNMYSELFMGFVAGARDVASLITVQWGATARIAGSTKPIRDSVVIILVDVIISSLEIFLFCIIYSIVMDHTMLWITPIIGFRTRRVPLVPIYIFVKAYSSNAEIVMILVLFVFTFTHMNSLICEFESLKFSISLVNQSTYLNANMISVGLIPVFYTCSLLCQTIESTISTPLPVSTVLSAATSVVSLLLFIIIFLIYSFKRFQYDIEFMTGTKTGKIVQLFLGFPVIYAIVTLVSAVLGLSESDLLLYISTIVSVLLAWVVYMITMFARHTRDEFKNMFVPVFFYGPPNHDLRKERKRLYRHDN